MAINLLGNTINQGPIKLSPSSNFAGGNYSATSTMGVAAKTPTSNLSSPATTLPKAQVAANTNLTANKGSLLSNAAAAAPKTSTIGSGISIAPSGKAIPSSYTIQSGDTLSSIAAKYGVDPQQLAISNNINNPNSIQAGGTLNFPTYKPTSSGGAQTATSGSSGGGSTGGGTQTDAAAVIPAGQSGTAGSTGNQYSQNAQGQWVLSSSLSPGSNNIGGNTDPVTSIPSNVVNNTPAQVDANTAQPNPIAPQAPATGAPTTPYSASNPPTSQAGLLGAALGQAQGYYNTQGGLTDKIQALDTNFANKEAALGEGYTGLGAQTPLESQGLENIKNNAVSAISQQQSAQAGYESPLSNLYGSAISATAPQLQAGMLTNPLNGQPLNPSLVENALKTIAPLVAAGTNPNDPQIQNIISQFGYYGATGLTQLEQAYNGSSYNPTNASAVANQNATTATNLGSQAAELTPALTGVQNTGNAIQSLISNGAANGLNALAPNWANTSIQSLQSKFTNNANVQSLALYTQEAQNYISQILQTGAGMTPSGAEQATQQLNLMASSPSAIATLMANIGNAGNIRSGSLQGAANAALASGNSLYEGAAAPPPAPATINTAPNALTGMTPQSQAGLGVIVGGVEDAWNWISNLLGGTASSVASGIGAGAGENAAGKLFGTGSSGAGAAAAAAVL